MIHWEGLSLGAGGMVRLINYGSNQTFNSGCRLRWQSSKIQPSIILKIRIHPGGDGLGQGKKKRRSFP